MADEDALEPDEVHTGIVAAYDLVDAVQRQDPQDIARTSAQLVEHSESTGSALLTLALVANSLHRTAPTFPLADVRRMAAGEQPDMGALTNGQMMGEFLDVYETWDQDNATPSVVGEAILAQWADRPLTIEVLTRLLQVTSALMVRMKLQMTPGIVARRTGEGAERLAIDTVRASLANDPAPSLWDESYNDREADR